MADINIGDLVARKSYGCDILFKVVEIIDHSDQERVFILRGIDMRVVADAPERDIVKQSRKQVEEFKRSNDRAVRKSINSVMGDRKRRNRVRGIKNMLVYRGENLFDRPGRVLHLDGDSGYLDICLEAYKKMEVNAVGFHVPENQQTKSVGGLLAEYLPDILVLTGHDAIAKEHKDINDIGHYTNSKHFVASVREARKFEPSYDDLVIFAGACQSHFEAILEAGANYASSPNRVLIHALDPVFICGKIALTRIDKIAAIQELISGTVSGAKGVGGLQTRGKYREGLPKSPYIEG